MEPTTLIDRLKRDHERVLRDIAELERALERTPRPEGGLAAEAAVRRVLEMLERQFATHMAAEDEILYPAIARALPTTAATLAPLHDEHAELAEMLPRLRESLRERKSADRDEQLLVQVHDLADLLRLHIRKEESLVFHVAARLLLPGEIDAVLNRMNAGASRNGARRASSLAKKGTVR